MALRIREAAANDAQALTRLATQLGYPSQPGDITRRLRDLFPLRDCVLVAVVDHNVVGWTHVGLYPTLLTDKAAHLYGTVVDEGWRGQGIGRALLEAAEAWATQRGCRTMYVRSNIVRQEAHAFYRGLGYRQVKTSLTFTKSLQEEDPHN